MEGFFRVIAYALVVFIIGTLGACSNYEQQSPLGEQDRYNSVDVENGIDGDNASLVAKIELVNETRKSSFSGDETRGFKQWLDGIKIGLADLRGGAAGLAAGGIGGMLLGALIYSLTCALILIMQDLGKEHVASSVMNQLSKERIECVYSSLEINPDVYKRVKDEAQGLRLSIPNKYANVLDVAIGHNALLYMYSDEYSDRIVNLSGSQDVKKVFENDSFNKFYMRFMDDPLTETLVTSKGEVNSGLYSTEMKILTLFMDACENSTANIKDVCELANEYINVIEEDGSLSDDGRRLVYGAMAIGVYSINFWDRNLNVYSVADRAQ